MGYHKKESNVRVERAEAKSTECKKGGLVEMLK